MSDPLLNTGWVKPRRTEINGLEELGALASDSEGPRTDLRSCLRVFSIRSKVASFASLRL